MMMPTGIWLTIVSYRDFYDFPRLMLAAEQDSKFWILDSEFNDQQDEYSPTFNIYFVGNDAAHARSAFELHIKGAKGQVAGTAHNTQLEFDSTKRQKFFLVDKS